MMKNYPKAFIQFFYPNNKLTDRILTSGSILFILTNLLIIILSFKQLPEQIPTHYNLVGKVDKYGDKSNLWILLFVSAFIFIDLTILIQSKFIFRNYKDPDKMNQPDDKNGRKTQLTLTVLRFIISLIFLIITAYTIIISK
ncbi:DUF1648 domain-containing protein [Chitinophaga silvatica]|uniref:DUF1648 domain-containing protein n=1 Tax=Chitinophaga silvatica TaxID=2282649 RepID=A0A3E1YBK4_9BACT|nr:DUF1648 domain-containing protein [Chitinophaga silvatica]RFS23390.1 DUF1648 domain-containing protein [Chitinophaga silvatica]